MFEFLKNFMNNKESNLTNGLTMKKFPLKTYIFGLISLTQIGFI